jgi:hypothetical protein
VRGSISKEKQRGGKIVSTGYSIAKAIAVTRRCPKCFILEGSESAEVCEIDGCPQQFDSVAVPTQHNPKPKRAKRGRPRVVCGSCMVNGVACDRSLGHSGPCWRDAVVPAWTNQPARLLRPRAKQIFVTEG